MGDPDVIDLERPPSRRKPGVAAVVAVLAFALGIGLGYQLHNRPSTPEPKPSVSAAANGPLEPTGARCSAQQGTRLQLGVQVRNPSGEAALQGVQVDLPLGGLRQVGGTWGACGQLSAPDSTIELHLGPGATTWLTATFDVLVDCPAPLPVRFTVAYLDGVGVARQDLLGSFADLGDVPYPGCP
ncbi:MAG: hypothetical protein HOU81_02365 [Hamadaea sp.]|uniref:hypothetical protein n=1 Tax=Hamadaea sp. TaxID=2024425 RepID=UPI0018589462|nr:hypothetical protein [Hamadaea sp.]NUR69639.1 hypothetical protein [Hamadaea sp.]NUT23345.1 hypothetical protein [Hamadaea sp.]